MSVINKPRVVLGFKAKHNGASQDKTSLQVTTVLSWAALATCDSCSCLCATTKCV